LGTTGGANGVTGAIGADGIGAGGIGAGGIGADVVWASKVWDARSKSQELARCLAFGQ
jgi:hypothetical protein